MWVVQNYETTAHLELALDDVEMNKAVVFSYCKTNELLNNLKLRR